MTQVHVLRTSYYMHYMYAQLYKAIKILCYKSWHLLEPKELQKTSSTIMIISWIKWLCSSSNIYRPDRLTYKVYPHKGVHKPVEVSCPFLPFCLLFCTVVYGVETFSVSVGVFFLFLYNGHTYSCKVANKDFELWKFHKYTHIFLCLTHWNRQKMAAILQTTFGDAFVDRKLLIWISLNFVPEGPIDNNP